MYRCDSCNRVVQGNRPANEVVTEIRNKTYPNRPRVHRRSGKKRRHWKDDPGGRGWEAARTACVCDDCLPEAREKFEAMVATVDTSPIVVETVDAIEDADSDE